MAKAPRRAPAIKRTKKQPRRTASETFLVNSKYLGKDRPESDGTEMGYIHAIRWHHYMSDKSEAKEYARDFLIKMGHSTEARKFSSVPDNSLPLTFCWTAKLYLDGWEISDERLEKTKNILVEVTKKAIQEKKESKSDDDPQKPSVYELTLEKISDFISDIEEVFDKGDFEFSMYEYLQVNQTPQKYVSRVIDYYTPKLEEYKLIGTKGNEDITEGYRHLTRKDIRERIKFLENILNDLSRWSDNQKKTRAPRKKKPVSADKKVSNLKYQKEDNSLRLQSVNPTSIINSAELFVYNTKYSTLTRYVALDRGGLDIKGQTILNFDPSKSVTKRLGRKASDILQTVLSGGKVQARKALETFKGKDIDPKGRINNDSILLRTL